MRMGHPIQDEKPDRKAMDIALIRQTPIYKYAQRHKQCRFCKYCHVQLMESIPNMKISICKIKAKPIKYPGKSHLFCPYYTTDINALANTPTDKEGCF